jgi:tetratricopeptide (TPR) repeat protein
MRIKLFFRAAVAALILAASVLVASAQSVTITGKVTLKQADGTEAPVEGAQIDIYRTDIKGEYRTKTNKKGEYTHAGIPYGTFTIAVSAPGARPTFQGGLMLGRQSNNNFTLLPGDGSRLTLEQIKAAGTAAPATGGTPAKESEETKKAREEYEKEVARVAEANKKIEESNTVVKRTFEAGNAAYTAKNYDEAVRQYNEGLAADPEQAVLHLNKSLALRLGAVDKYNAAVKAKDQAGREAAKADFKASAESADKAVQLFRAQQAKSAGAAAGAPVGAGQPSEMMNYLSARMESYRVGLQTNAGVDASQAVTALEEYIAVEPDAAKKAKAEAGLAQALFLGGRIDESVATSRKILVANPSNIDAMYWLGIALASDEAKAAEARDVLKDFAAKAPATDTRKAEAEAAVAALEEAMKPKQTDKSTTTGGRRRGGKP